jgi:hypothetical protein
MFSSSYNCIRFENSVSGIAQTVGLGQIETATPETFYRGRFRYDGQINSFLTNSSLSQSYDGLCFQKVPDENCPPASHLDAPCQQHIITSSKC